MSRRRGSALAWIRILIAIMGCNASAARERRLRLVRPQNLSLTALYNDVASAYATADWTGARAPAQRGKALVYSYLNFSDPPPPLAYERLLDNDHNVIGLYYYTLVAPGDPRNERIEIKTGLDDETEFFVAVHELLHFGGFGTVHSLDPESPKINAAAQRFATEFDGVAPGDPVIGVHWESVSGTHVRSGRSASEEVMTPAIGGNAFLATATLAACDRAVDGGPAWCDTDDDCAGEAECLPGQATTPGHCNATGTLAWPHTDAAGDAFVAILVSSLVIVVFVLIGLMLAWFEGTHARYEKVGIEL